jgi:carbon storage regulator
MLVLSRKQGEQLLIGDNVTITVLEVRGRVLKLVIDAPRGVRILRAELDPFNEPRQTVRSRKVSAMSIVA